MNFLENLPKDAKSVDLNECNDEVALGNGSPNKDLMGQGSLFDIS